MPALPALVHAATAQLDGLLVRGSDSRLAIRQASSPSPYDAPAPAQALTVRALEARDVTNGIIPTYYTINGPGAAAVVGIVLGSVVGFIVLVWLLYTLTQGGMPGGRGTIPAEEEIVVRRRRNSGGRSRRSTRAEMRERDYSRSPRQSGGRSFIVEERRAQRPRSRSIVVESRIPGDDVVEVIEERDYRRGSRRGSQYR